MSETEAATYPKMLYLHGQAYTDTGRGVPHQDTRLVNDEAEEAAAREEGFSEASGGAGEAVTEEPAHVAEEPAAEAGEETQAPSEPAETLEGGAGADHVEDPAA